MALFHIVVLAVVQGITEFLPISSSAHLILVPKLTGWPDQGLFIDVAVHVGTLGAVIAYFWRDVWLMLAGVGRLAKGQITAGARLLALLALATIPVVAAGYAMQEIWGGNFRDHRLDSSRIRRIPPNSSRCGSTKATFISMPASRSRESSPARQRF